MRAQMVRSRSLFLRATRHSQMKRWMGLLASSSFLIIFMTLCAPPPFTQASADMLDINMQVADQYTLDTPEVGLNLTFAKQGDAGASPGENLSMACNGVTFPHLRGNFLLQIKVPRQPAGGTYTCVYTDEKGIKTPFIIPIPAGTLAITSPKAHDTVPIPNSASSSPGATPTPGNHPTKRQQHTHCSLYSANHPRWRKRRNSGNRRWWNCLDLGDSEHRDGYDRHLGCQPAFWLRVSSLDPRDAWQDQPALRFLLVSINRSISQDQHPI